MSDKKMRATYVEINLSALQKNFLRIKHIIGENVGILATVKQDAYGHGAVGVSRVLENLGVTFLGVARVDEAFVLRRNRIKAKILNLGVISSFGEAKEIVDMGISQTINTFKQATYLNRYASSKDKIVNVHLKIDTGMTRLGLPFSSALELLSKVRRLSHLYVEGIFTHFPVADKDPDFTLWQIRQFDEFVREVKRNGLDVPFIHASNSAGVLNYPEGHFNLVRPGIVLYGVSPFNYPLKGFLPVMSVKSIVVFERKIPKNTPVGYGRSFISSRSMYIAVVPIGYGDGYPFGISGKGEVLIHGERYPILGRVCMDFIIVGSYTRKFRVGEKVIVMGKQKKESIRCEEISSLSGTISYETLCRFGKNLPHVYI